MALTTAACDKMVAAANKAKKLLFVGHVLPFLPEYATALKTINSGKYGAPLGGTFKRVISDPTWLKDFFDPARVALNIDPVHLAIMLTLAVEMSVVTPPVGLNLFAVSGTANIPVTEVVKGSVPFFLTDLLVLILVIFFPILATWLPNLLVTDIFK
jgi:hypothetical protein